MMYHILTKGNAIASFEHEGDRRVCLCAFEDVYPDCEFESQDEIELPDVQSTMDEIASEY